MKTCGLLSKERTFFLLLDTACALTSNQLSAPWGLCPRHRLDSLPGALPTLLATPRLTSAMPPDSPLSQGNGHVLIF